MGSVDYFERSFFNVPGNAQARLGMAGVLHSVSLYMLPCSGKVISVYGGIINVRIIDVKKLEKTPTRKEKIT